MLRLPGSFLYKQRQDWTINPPVPTSQALGLERARAHAVKVASSLFFQNRLHRAQIHDPLPSMFCCLIDHPSFFHREILNNPTSLT